MRITLLGTCSGTEAMPGRRHTALMLEAGGRLYQFDAGDSCAYTAHLLGFDVTKITALFITHPHIDHVGGLPYLMFTLDKMLWRKGIALEKPIDVYAPSDNALRAAALLTYTREAQTQAYAAYRPVSDGLVFDDGVIRVTARHNTHLKENCAPWHSYSYLVEGEGARVVISGDIGHISELDDWSGCHLMLLESRHHKPWESAAHLAALPKWPETLVFYHHGRDMLADPQGVTARAALAYPGRVICGEDGMAITVGGEA